MITGAPSKGTAPLDLRRFWEEMRARADGEASKPPPLARRLVPVTGTSPAEDLVVGDLAVLDRKTLGRRNLVRLADELALRGAAGLIVSKQTVAPLPADLRRAIEER